MACILYTRHMDRRVIITIEPGKRGD